MMGGEWFEEHFGNVDDNIKDTSKVILAAIEGAKVHLGFKKNPVRVLAAVHKVIRLPHPAANLTILMFFLELHIPVSA